MSDDTGGDETPAGYVQRFGLVCSYCIIGLCLIGTVGNSLSIYVYVRPHFRRQSINVLLAALSSVDGTLMVLAIPVFGYGALVQLFGESAEPTLLVLLVCLYPLALMLQSASVWLLVVVTVERWLAVCRPFLVGTYCTRKRAVTVIAGVMSLSVVFNAARFWEYEMDDVAGKPRLKLNLRNRTAYLFWYQNVATSLSQFLVPVVALSVLNLQIVRTIHKAGEARQLLGAQRERDHRTANMMFRVVVVFVACYLLTFVLSVIEIVNRGLFTQSVGQLLNDVNNLLVITNSASTFLFYLNYSSRYRHEINLLWCRLCCPQRYAALLAETALRRRAGGGASGTPLRPFNSSANSRHRTLSTSPYGSPVSVISSVSPLQCRTRRCSALVLTCAQQPLVSVRKSTLAPPPTVYGSGASGNTILRSSKLSKTSLYDNERQK